MFGCVLNTGGHGTVPHMYLTYAFDGEAGEEAVDDEVGEVSEHRLAELLQQRALRAQAVQQHVEPATEEQRYAP